MELRELKVKLLIHINKLPESTPKEREIKHLLIVKTNSLRNFTLPNYLNLLMLVDFEPQVTLTFKHVVKQMVDEIAKYIEEAH